MTILFKEDWITKYPNAIIDTRTKNKSFIRLAALYREIGIKNHNFLLALHDPTLSGVDPYDPDLTMDQKLRIALECKDNFWYFIRECIRTPDGTDDNPILFRANRGNIALFWLFLNHITQILIQPRQTGKSINTNALMAYLLNIRCTKTHINQINKDESLRAKSLAKLKEIINELPPYLIQLSKKDVANNEEIKISSLGNSFESHLPSSSPKQAYKLGRGHTSAVWWIEEAAFLLNISISMPSALAAGGAAREIARIKNEPYGTIITTTAGKKDDRDGKFVYNLLVNSAVWMETFLDADNEEDLRSLIKTNSPNGEIRVNCTFSHKQLGYSDEWLQEQLMETGASGEDADRDYFNLWTAGNQSSPIPIDIAERVRASEVKDYFNEITPPHAYITRWFIPEQTIAARMSQTHLVMGLDTSDAVGNDDIGMHLRCIKTGETFAAGNYNETNLIAFAEWLCQWLARYKNITLIIERRSSAITIIDYLLLMLPERGIDPFTRLYNRVVQEATEYPERFAEINKPLYAKSPELFVKYKKYFGFATSATGATSRSELYSTTLMQIMQLTADKVKDPTTINQLLSLVIRNNRVDHDTDGGHDDNVIAMLLTGWLVLRGKHLHYSGISNKDLLKDNQVLSVQHTPVNQYNKQYNDMVRYEIDSLVQRISKERDEYVCINLENKLKMLYTRLCEEDRQMFSVDDLINTLRSTRQQGRTHQAIYG